MTTARKTVLADLARAINPIKFAESLGIDPDPWQRELLLSTRKRVILNCSRQSGKSTITAVLALHHALNYPGALVLVLSPSLRQSGELFRKVRDFYRDLGKPIGSETDTAFTREVANRSRVVSLPGKEQTVRGFSGASLLIIDEAARVPDDLYFAVRPMVAVSQGRVILLSTPYGKQGFFYEAWHATKERWEKVMVTAYDCPRITPETLEAEKESLGAWWFRQEYLCSFEQDRQAVFDYDSVQAVFANRIEAWSLTGSPETEPSYVPDPKRGEPSDGFVPRIIVKEWSLKGDV
jgi:hypothetical protein